MRLNMFKIRKKNLFYLILSQKTSQNDLKSVSFLKNDSNIVQKDIRRVPIPALHL